MPPLTTETTGLAPGQRPPPGHEEKVDVDVLYPVHIDGKGRKPGDTVTVSKGLARELIASRKCGPKGSYKRPAAPAKETKSA